MAKKIAVLARARPGEALRMSLGLTLLDDIVDVYVLGGKLDAERHALHLQTVRDMEMKLYTDCRDNAGMEFLARDEIARRLPAYDHVLPY